MLPANSVQPPTRIRRVWLSSLRCVLRQVKSSCPINGLSYRLRDHFAGNALSRCGILGVGTRKAAIVAFACLAVALSKAVRMFVDDDLKQGDAFLQQQRPSE